VPYDPVRGARGQVMRTAKIFKLTLSPPSIFQQAASTPYLRIVYSAPGRGGPVIASAHETSIGYAAVPMQPWQFAQTNVSRSGVYRGLSFAAHFPAASSVCDVGGGGDVGLYSGLGFAGVLNCLIPVFFGFFFSRPRLSRLPMTCSFLLS
jgi:hypothetical protein